MTRLKYLDAIGECLATLHDQEEAILRAGELCADHIAAGRLVHVFGAGHSRMMCEEAYPRIGAVVGFHPIVELAVTYFTPVVGGSGLRQALFLERVPGYGRVILEESVAEPGDAVIVFSSSGVEHIIMDFVDAAQEAKLPVIGVTSLEYSGSAAAERDGARRLADCADLVIDNHVPAGDALVQLDGLEERVGPSASILNLAIMDSIAVATAEALLRRDVDPLVFSSPHLVGAERSAERFDQCLDEFRKRVWGTRG
jgi:uncharacterized phosphosugar-binding protein